MAIPCTACGRPKSETAVVCPHCGATDAGRDPRDHAAAQSKARGGEGAGAKRAPLGDAAVLLESSAPRRAFWADFLTPSPNLGGLWPLVDLVLIALTLPLIAGVLLSLVRPAGDRARVVTVTGQFVENVLVALLGGGIVLAIAARTDHFTTVASVVAVAVLALFGRVALRVVRP